MVSHTSALKVAILSILTTTQVVDLGVEPQSVVLWSYLVAPRRISLGLKCDIAEEPNPPMAGVTPAFPWLCPLYT